MRTTPTRWQSYKNLSDEPESWTKQSPHRGVRQRSNPTQPTSTSISACCFQKGQNWDSALTSFNETLTQQRWHVPALATKAVNQHEAGDDAATTSLLDMDGLRTLQELSLPDGTDVQALGDLLANHSSCIWERSDTTTPAGAQRSNLAKDTDPTIGTFLTTLKEKIESYFRTKQPDPGHPFTAHIPESWDYGIWATILDQDRHQDPHLHPAAWVSGVY